MAQSQTFYTRIAQKHDTETNWKKIHSSFIPLAGEIIVYDADSTYNYPRIKIGNGVSNGTTVTGTTLGNLPFIDDGAIAEIASSLGKLSIKADGNDVGIAFNGTLINGSKAAIPYAGSAGSAGTANKVVGALTLKAGTKSVGYDGSANKTFEVTAADLGLSGAMHFLGKTNTTITDGGTEKPVIGSSTITPIAGDVVLYGNAEFVYTSENKWELLGDEGSYLLKGTYNTDKANFVDDIQKGATNGTIKYSKFGSDSYTEVAVAGLGSAAYTNSNAYAPASHTTVSATASALGHVKLSDTADTTKTAAAGGWAVTPAALATTNANVATNAASIGKILEVAYTRTTGNVISKIEVKDGKINVSSGALTYQDVPKHGFSSAGVVNGTYLAGETNWGHAAVSDSLVRDMSGETDNTPGAAKGVAASRKAVAGFKAEFDAYKAGLTLDKVGGNEAANWVLFNCGTSTSVL